ncbi:MAG: hypothetical protein ACRCZZ_11050 [Phocaeicola sp.]
MKVLNVNWNHCDYSIVTIENNYTPYVVVYGYDADSQTWAYGQYFSTWEAAKAYHAEKMGF